MTINNSKFTLSKVRYMARIYYRALNHIYAFIVALYIALRFVIGEKWVIIAFFDTFAHLLWLAAIILCVLNLISRQWRLAFIMLPGVLAFLLTWGVMFLPKNTVAAATDTSLRILTFNLKGDNSEQEAIIQVIREVDADIVALQELSHINSSAMETELQDLYPYMALHRTANVTQGQGILSRYPIVDDTFWIPDFAANMLGQQRVEISLENKHSIVLYNVHPSHPGMQNTFFDPQYRGMEVDAILQRSTKEELPHLLLGDFNMPELSDDYAQIRTYYTDAYRLAGFGMGWSFPNTSLIPTFLRLDYLFYDENFVAQNAQVWSSGAGSDHRPLVVDLSIINQ